MGKGTAKIESRIGERRTENTVSVWELYTTGEYERIVREYSQTDNSDVRGILLLAALELKPLQEKTEGAGLFSVLLEGMQAYHRRDFERAAFVLGSWLLKKDYFSELLLCRFIESARRASRYELVYSVSQKYLDRTPYRSLLANNLLISAFHLQKYREVLELFRNFREIFSDFEVIQYVGLSLVRLGQYEEARRVLLRLYRRLQGNDYEVDYESVRYRYSALIEKIPQMERQKNLDPATRMDLGLAYLFSSRYNDALRVFESLRSKRP